MSICAEAGLYAQAWDKLAIVPCEPKKAPYLHDGCGMGHFLITSIFLLSVAIPWVETMCPRYMICLQNSLHFEGFSSQFGLFQFLEHGLQAHKMTGQVFWKDAYII